jgi:hypothetical protein
MENAYKIFVAKPESKEAIRSRPILEDNIKMLYRNVVWEYWLN